MALLDIIPQPLVFHDSLDKQYHKVEGVGTWRDTISHFDPRSLPPFVIVRDTDSSPFYTISTVEEDGTTVVITPVTMHLFTFEGKDYIYPDTSALSASITCGTYYLKLIMGTLFDQTTYYSDLFNYATVAEINKMVKVVWSDTNHRGGVPYPLMAGFEFNVFLKSEVGRPTNNVTEKYEFNGVSDVLVHSRITRLHLLKDVVPEYIAHAMTFMSMNANRAITIPFNEGASNDIYEVDNVQANIKQIQPHREVDLEMTFRKELDTNSAGCGIGELPECYTVCETVKLAIEDSDIAAIEAAVPTLGDAYLIYSGGANEGEIITWNGSTWDYTDPTVGCLVEATKAADVFDQYWKVWSAGTVLPYNETPILTNPSGSQIDLTIEYDSGRFARIYLSTDNITFTLHPTVYTEDQLEAGITLNTASDTWYIKIEYYTHNCDFGYSDVDSITV